MSNVSALERLREWFVSQCDGDWEHTYGIKIETLDNPGWLVMIDLADTVHEGVSRAREISERTSTDWVQSEVVDRKFIGCGGLGNLEEILEMFLELVEGDDPP